jgi:hypothetical protein
MEANVIRKIIALALVASLAGCIGDADRSGPSSAEEDALVLLLLAGGGGGHLFGWDVAPRQTGTGTLELVAEHPLDALAGAQIVASRAGLPDLVVADVDVAPGAARAELYPVRGSDLRRYLGGTVRVREAPGASGTR